jgi:GMP synthase (glutamine-hydrolysing)
MIAIIDFGSQVAHLIARRIRSLNVYAEILAPDAVSETVIAKSSAFILSGGPESVYDQKINFNKDILYANKPILGICYGHQLIAHEFGGKVLRANRKEFGIATLAVAKEHRLFARIPRTSPVWMSHGDTVEQLPAEFEILAESDNCKAAAIGCTQKKIFGVQFHPEVIHTQYGVQLLENFLTIADIERDWHPDNLQNKLINEIKAEVGDDAVLIGLSGGIDSLVAACLLRMAIDDKLHCVYVDSGLTRIGDTHHVQEVCKALGFSNLSIIDASAQFLKNLENISEPEEKRRIIGHTFIEIFETAKQKIEKEKNIRFEFLAQGTIYPDRIESAQASVTASKIKTHHNTALPDTMQLRVIEPLRDLYKDEVRALAKQLHIPAAFLQRHPFPGPGLAIRILGTVDAEKLESVRNADYIFTQELQKTDWYNKVWQSLAALIPVKTVGVMGDHRSYEYMIVLRAITSIDGMTADWAKLPDTLLTTIATRIVNEVAGVNRVLYDITQKPPATIEYE